MQGSWCGLYFCFFVFFEVVSFCHFSHDIICKDCPSDTFSYTTTAAECSDCANCTYTETECTSISDTVCQSNSYYIIKIQKYCVLFLLRLLVISIQIQKSFLFQKFTLKVAYCFFFFQMKMYLTWMVLRFLVIIM